MGFDLGRAAGFRTHEIAFDDVEGEVTYAINRDVVVGNQAIPQKILFKSGGGPQPWLTMGIELRNGEIACTHLELNADSDTVRTAHLKLIRVERWVGQIAAACAKQLELTEKQRPGRRSYRLVSGPATVEQVRTVERMQRRRRDPKNDLEFLKKVAAVYLANPTSPNKAVAKEFDVTPRTASRWAGYATDADLLPEIEHGKKRI